MLHTNRGELQLLFDTFCRVWGAGGQATLTTTTQGGELKANLEIQVGSPSSPRPGAPPTSTSNAPLSSSQRFMPGHPGAVAHHRRRRRPRHRGPAAKARSRARAAAHQASLAAASSTTPTVNMSCVSAAGPLISFEAPSAPAPGATLPPPSVAPAELPPPPAPERPPTHSSPAPGGAQPPPLDPEEFEELELALAEECCVLCTIARWPPGRSPASTVSEHILIKADMENGDPVGMLETVLFCDEHRVTIL